MVCCKSCCGGKFLVVSMFGFLGKIFELERGKPFSTRILFEDEFYNRSIQRKHFFR